MATPSIPPRPSRAHDLPQSSANMDIPKIPPRPKRSVDRSVSPNREAYARSPLNAPPGPGLYKTISNNQSSSSLNIDLPPRPPSVTLPSIGQEGNEYASLEDLHRVTSSTSQDGSPQQTKNVAGDLPLHAPKASVPATMAKRNISAVTRTDSSQAAAAVGKLGLEDKSAQGPDSGRSDSSAGNHTRPTSMIEKDEEHGIPEIGLQVPMYPNAGDVQAPTPSPYDQQAPTGVGFFNKGGQSSGRHHGRTKSGREIFRGPPGSYGLHGHGIVPNDDFEKKWYEKHPEDFKREKAGEYGPHIQENRKDYHWVGDDLVKLVRSSGTKGLGMGTSRDAVGTPDEQIGYMASEEYASRMASPRPDSSSGRPASVKGVQVQVSSPLRQEKFSQEQLSRQRTQDSEAEEDVIHIDPPSRRASKVGGGGYDPPTEDLGPHGGNTAEEGGWVTERGYGIPILASDEIEKDPEAEYRQPAVDPELERRLDDYTANDPEGQPAYVTKYRSSSRNSSRNNSIQPGMPGLHRVISPLEHNRSGTPLESTKEYEPLFPEDEESPQKPKSAIDKFKRPDLARHHFPSQDVWEDTPTSLQLQTTVETPQAPEEPKDPAGEAEPAEVFETPEAEQARKEHITPEDQESFLPEHTKRFAKSHVSKAHLVPDRPGMQHRFPSHDIWEDAPEHGQLVTTVSGPQTEDTSEYADDAPASDKATASARPSVPARPQKATEISPVDKKAPGLPEKPKPQIPARPSKPIATKSSERVPTTEGQAEATQPKAKPAVPARPGGSKIAALKAGFLNDLNSKLGMGPQAPKVKEPEPENEEEPAKPLSDARKSRAKGPQRRKPTSSPSPAAATVTAEVAVPPQKLEVSEISTIWSIGNDGGLDVPAHNIAQKISSALKAPEKDESTEKPEEPQLDVAKSIVNKGADAEPEEAELAKTLTAESQASHQSSKAVGLDEDPRTQAPLEKSSSFEIPVKSEKTDVEIPEKNAPQAPEGQPLGINTDEPPREEMEMAEARI